MRSRAASITAASPRTAAVGPVKAPPTATPARVRRGARRQLETLKLPRDLRPARRRQAIVARVQLDGAGAEARRCFDGFCLRIDEQADPDPRVAEAPHDLLERPAGRHGQPTL